MPVPKKPYDRTIILLDTDLPPHEKLLGLAVAAHLNQRGVTRLSIRLLSAKTSLSRSSVFRVLNDAVAAGWLHRIQEHRHASVFRIDWGVLETRRLPALNDDIHCVSD